MYAEVRAILLSLFGIACCLAGASAQPQSASTSFVASSITSAPASVEQLPPSEPSVTYENGALTISAYNSTLSAILERIRSKTGADIEIPPQADERVATRLGPGPARDVLDSLLTGSRFNYILVGSSSDQSALTRVVLLPRPPAEVSSQREANIATRVPTSQSMRSAEIQPLDATVDNELPVRAQQRMLQQHQQAVMEQFQRNRRADSE